MYLGKSPIEMNRLYVFSFKVVCIYLRKHRLTSFAFCVCMCLQFWKYTYIIMYSWYTCALLLWYLCIVSPILGVLQFQFADNTTLAVSRPPADGGWGPTRWVMSCWRCCPLIIRVLLGWLCFRTKGTPNWMIHNFLTMKVLKIWLEYEYFKVYVWMTLVHHFIQVVFMFEGPIG